MLVLNLAILPRGKYLLRKAFEKASHIVKELGALFCNQSLTLSFNKNWKSLNRITSLNTPFSLNVLYFVSKL